MVSIALNVSDEFKAMIERLPWVNWSEVAREEAIKHEEKVRLFEELCTLTKDSTLTDDDCLLHKCFKTEVMGMERLVVEKPKQISWEYDKEADVLYISFGKPQKALSMDMGSGIVARYLQDSNELVGFTLVGLKHVLRQAK